jgi:hypothetical protein
MDRQGDDSNASTWFIQEETLQRAFPIKKSGIQSHLQASGRNEEVGGEVQGMSMGGKILSGPLTLLR